MKTKNIFWGIFFILSAVLIVLNQLGLFVEVGIFELVVTLLLIPIMIKSARHLHFGGVLFPLAIIGIMFSDVLSIEALTPWPILGVALFLSIGLSFIFSKNRYHYECSHEECLENVSEETENKVNIRSRFSGSVKYINSQALEEVDIISSFGGIKIYFDNAKINNNEAHVHIDASFSGVELYVPKEWKIKNNMDCTMGGVEEKGVRIQNEQEKTLILSGYARFSGISIIHV